MNLTLELRPEIERNLLVQAEAKGLSLADFAKELLTQQARLSGLPRDEVVVSSGQAADNLYELFAPIRGLLTDQEIDQFFDRTTASSRAADLG